MLEALEQRHLLAVFTVNSVSDLPDPDLFDGVCATQTPGEVSLRAAIQNANLTSELDEIHFAIAGEALPSIAVGAESLPAITAPLIIDGTTQSAGRVEINGQDVTGSANGLVVKGGANGSTLRGLVINRFAGTAIVIEADNLTVTGNFLGLDGTGTTFDPDGTPRSGDELGNAAGIWIRTTENGGGFNNQIGGSQPELANVISGNGLGVIISTDVGGNRVQGNMIGTDRTGALSAGAMDSFGIYLSANPADLEHANIVGGEADGQGNIISGNETGIWLNGSNNIVAGNRIGTNAAGTSAIGNDWGIRIVNILLALPGQSDVITDPDPTPSHNVIGGTRGNLIAGNERSGISIEGTGTNRFEENRILGNWIGVDASGLGPLPNGEDGIALVLGGGSTQIGSPDEAGRNVIAANLGHGIGVYQVQGDDELNTTIAGNYIGLAADGVTPLGNQGNGVHIEDSSHIYVAPGNVISANADDGVWISGGSINAVNGSIIGLDKNEHGGPAIANGGAGVRAINAAQLQIGEASLDAPNIIANNSGSGIDVSGPQTIHIGIDYNLIGTNRRWDAGLGNGEHGIRLDDATDVQIGRVFGKQFISGNAGHGIFLGHTTDVAIEQNAIGIVPKFDAATLDLQLALPNGQDGVHLEAAVNTSLRLNTIAGNTGHGVAIAQDSAYTSLYGNAIGLLDESLNLRVGNGGHGVLLSSGTATIITPGSDQVPNSIEANGLDGIATLGDTTATIRGNRIRDNGELGIDRGDDGPDTVASLGGNYSGGRSVVSIDSLEWTETGIALAGTLVGLPNTQYALDFYGTTAADSSGYGEGEQLIPSADGAPLVVTTDATGQATLSTRLIPPMALGTLRHISASATEGSATSEFSGALEFEPSPDLMMVEFGTASGSLTRLRITYDVYYLDVAAFEFTILSSSDGIADAGDAVQGTPIFVSDPMLLTVGRHLVDIVDPAAYLANVTNPATPYLLAAADRAGSLSELSQNNNTGEFVGPPYHNLNVPWDVDHDQAIVEEDFDAVAGYLNDAAIGDIDAAKAAGRLIDVTGDGLGTPLDALVIANYLATSRQPVPLLPPAALSALNFQAADPGPKATEVGAPVGSLANASGALRLLAAKDRAIESAFSEIEFGGDGLFLPMGRLRRR